MPLAKWKLMQILYTCSEYCHSAKYFELLVTLSNSFKNNTVKTPAGKDTSRLYLLGMISDRKFLDQVLPQWPTQHCKNHLIMKVPFKSLSYQILWVNFRTMTTITASTMRTSTMPRTATRAFFQKNFFLTCRDVLWNDFDWNKKDTQISNRNTEWELFT